MAIKIIEFVLFLICAGIISIGVILPIGRAIIPLITKMIYAIFFPLFSKSQLEKQKEALIAAKERIRIAEIQQETMQAEKIAMRIQESIFDEEFEELVEVNKKSR